MGKIAKDFKNLIVGNEGNNDEPADFKTEIANALKEEIITKADATILISARTIVDNNGEKLIKGQEDEVKNIDQNALYDTLEEAIAADKEEKKKKKKKEEEERKRKLQEQRIEQAMQTPPKTKKGSASGGKGKSVSIEPKKVETKAIKELNDKEENSKIKPNSEKMRE